VIARRRSDEVAGVPTIGGGKHGQAHVASGRREPPGNFDDEGQGAANAEVFAATASGDYTRRMPVVFRLCRLALAFAVVAFLAGPLPALDYVTIRQGTSEKELAGRVEVEAVDGGVLLLTPDGVLWPIETQDIVSRRSDDKPFEPLDRDELARQLTSELPGFKIHQTRNFLVCYNTSQAYAQWVGALFERLHSGFYNYWTRSGAELHEPQFPLVALVFDSKQAYALHARTELGDATSSITGYYSLKSNRMTMYDLTGVENGSGRPERTSAARINKILAAPAAERTVATIVHEATHQLAFNSGLQKRFADVPFWASEGVAIYFETPDLDSDRGWRSIGRVNRFNLINFRKGLRMRPAGALETLLSDDKPFRDPKTAASAYAEAWALNYFLLQRRREDYVKYLRALAEQTPLVTVEPAERVRLFKEHFGDDLTTFEAEFLRYMKSVD
jgi:hypothetical protein